MGCKKNFTRFLLEAWKELLLSLLEVYICKENLKFGPIVHKLGMYLYYILWTFLWKDREFRDRFLISKVHDTKPSFKNPPKKLK